MTRHTRLKVSAVIDDAVAGVRVTPETSTVTRGQPLAMCGLRGY